MKKGSTKYAPIFNGLWDIKHVQKMGMAVFLFGELLDRVGSKGEVEVSYRELFDKTEIPIRTLERWMQKLKSGNYISTQGKNPMIVKIANFRLIKNGRFFTPIEHENSPSNVAETLQNVAGPDSASLINTVNSTTLLKYKSNKRSTSKKSNDFEGGKKEKKPRRFIFTQADKETAIFILGKIQNIQPRFKEPNLKSWANDVRLIRERDGRTHNEIRTLFSWANDHHFWKANIHSGPSVIWLRFKTSSVIARP